MSLNTPILFLIFNRPAVTNIVFEQIKKIKPKQLFVAADGPRKNKPEEKERCEETRKIIDKVDWDCEVKTLFREDNRGCGLGVSEAITWFFDNVNQGIILEDDILPDITFFPFCETLLEKYKDDDNISVISGTNFLRPNYEYKDTSYFFSEYVGCWGWASWRRAWEGFDYNISSWDSKTVRNGFKKRFVKGQFLFFKEIFDSVCMNNKVDIWDYQWWYHRLKSNSLGIMPSVNLVKNIGFGADATHTFAVEEGIANAEIEKMDFPLKHPLLKDVNSIFDLALAKKQFWKEKESLSIKRKLQIIKYKLYVKLH